jgi:hypothetical protein
MREVEDPTSNVMALVEAAVKRIDDIADLRSEYADRLEEMRRYYGDKLRDNEKELRRAESDRIDAIRAVDVGNVQRAAEVSAAQAEALRNTVAAAAGAAATSLAGALDPIQKDIADLRRAQYEAQGQKTQVAEIRQTSGVAVAVAGLAVSAMIGLIALAGVILATR